MEKLAIGINGFGRIGRQVFRIAFEHEKLQVTHINDIADAQNLAYLLKHDSTYGAWAHGVQAEDNALYVNDKKITVSSAKEPSEIEWSKSKVSIVLESTGFFRKKEDAQKHLSSGTKKVLVSAPGKTKLDGDFIIGVNDEYYDKERHNIISIGSCTTNCLAPIAKVLHDQFRIHNGLINTVHAYTASQKLLDSPAKKWRRGRSAAENLIPTSTGAAAMIGQIIPDLNGKLDGLAIRVPVKCGSLLDLTCSIETKASVDEINQAFQRQSAERMRGILHVEMAPTVSSDVLGSRYSAVVSAQDTQVLNGEFVKVLAWYDNEWAFSCRCVDMMARML